MANFDLNNFVIDRVLRGVMLSHTDDSVMFSINQITNPQLTVSSESTDAVDAMGVPIQTFYRAKTCEFSAENALFDLSLMAVQSGADKNVASTTSTVRTPAFETIDIVEGTASYNLKHTPVDEVTKIYLLNGDSTLGTVYELATSASAKNFALTGKILTPPTGLKTGEQLFVIYEYEATQAVSVVSSAKNFPTGGKFIMEVLGTDVCDSTKLLYAYLIFPNFKLSPVFDWNVATDSTHNFSGKAQQEYCDKNKTLFQLIVPGDE